MSKNVITEFKSPWKQQQMRDIVGNQSREKKGKLKFSPRTLRETRRGGEDGSSLGGVALSTELWGDVRCSHAVRMRARMEPWIPHTLRVRGSEGAFVHVCVSMRLWVGSGHCPGDGGHLWLRAQASETDRPACESQFPH